MKLTPEASMRMRASPGPGVGVGRSRRVRTSAEPVVRIWMACMAGCQGTTVGLWVRSGDIRCFVYASVSTDKTHRGAAIKLLLQQRLAPDADRCSWSMLLWFHLPGSTRWCFHAKAKRH